MPVEYAFEIDSTVGRYWLANASGFELVERGGRRLGVVEDVVLDPSTQEVDVMVVKRRASIGRARVPPNDLTAVVPAAKLFVVAAGTGEALSHNTVASGAHRVAGVLVTAARSARDQWPAVRRSLAAAAAVLAAGGRWARDHGPAVRRFLASAAASTLLAFERAAVVTVAAARRVAAFGHERWVSGRRSRGDR
jgi:hypothetical protein